MAFLNLNSRSALSLAASIVLIVLGVLFFVYLPHDTSDLVTDAIFVAFGIMLLRGAFPRKPGETLKKGSLPRSERRRKEREGK